MNRILFEKDEIRDGVATFGGERAEHVLNVLHGEVGQILKTGEIDGPIGTSVIEKISGTGILPVQDGRDVADERTGVPPVPRGKDCGTGILPVHAGAETVISVRCSHTEESRRPWVDLILAPPRPRVMKRLLPQLATMGVGRIFLVGAKKVEKDFWGATLLKPENYRPLLIDGLMQAGTSILPTLETRRNFRKFVSEELNTLFPSSKRIVAHPYGTSANLTIAPSGQSANQTTKQPNNQTILLAIGPEGGWTDDEVTSLEEHGFTRYSLGLRILRTDTATIALLAQLMQVHDQE